MVRHNQCFPAYLATPRSQKCSDTPSFSLTKCDPLPITQPVAQRQWVWCKTCDCHSRWLQASDFSPALGCFHTACVPAQLQTFPRKCWTGSRASSWPGLSPQENLQPEKVLAGAHPPHWTKCPQHSQVAMTMHKFSLSDRHAQPGLRKLLFSFKHMLCFSRENCVCLIYLFISAVIYQSVFSPDLWLCQTTLTKFKEGFYLFWICYLPPAIFISCHLILVSEETTNSHCLCTFSSVFFPPSTSVYKLQSTEKPECQRIVNMKWESWSPVFWNLAQVCLV